MPVRRGAPLSDFDVTKSGLTEEQITQIEPVIATAVGLATGGSAK
jgi:hypothetical protein